MDERREADPRRSGPTARLRILHIGALPPHPNGDAIVAGQILRRLAAAGHHVTALAPAAPDLFASGDGLDSEDLGFAVLPYPVPHFLSARPLGGGDTAYRRAEDEQLRQRLPPLLAGDARPNVVIVGRMSLCWTALPLCQARDVPAVLLAHGGRSFALLESGRAVAAPAALARIAELGQFRRIIAVAHHLGARLHAMGCPRVAVIPNPVELERFRPGPRDRGLAAALRIARRQVVVLHASAFQPVKRVPDLIASARMALARNHKLVYLMVGDGPGRAQAEADCREAGIADAFRFVGRVPHRCMPAYMRVADLVAMPSDSEGQSLVCLEAQASGRAVLAADIPGARELVTDGETGLLSPVGDVAALAARTVALAADADLRRRLGRAARRAARTHAVAGVVGRYEEVLAAAAGAPASPAAC